jgi:hypothetical protein
MNVSNETIPAAERSPRPTSCARRQDNEQRMRLNDSRTEVENSWPQASQDH